MEKKFHLTSVQLGFAAFGSAIIGVIATFIILTDPFASANIINDGGARIDSAYDQAMGHSDHIIKDWRKNTHGIWYDTARLSAYITQMRKFMDADSLQNVLPHYVWRVGIYYAKGIDTTGNGSKNPRKGLITMFLPVLEDTSVHKVIDVFTARRYYKNKDFLTPLPWDKNITYFSIYEKFYARFEPSDLHSLTTALDDYIVFDSGNMFP